MPYKDPEKQKEAQRQWEKKNRGRGVRHRVWMFVFYPDSADPDWREIADELGLPFCVSPLHDSDFWTARDERKNPKHIEGEVKKAHWHGLAEYPQPVDFDTVKEDFKFLGTTNIKYAKSKASMALYLCHIGCKDKVQYDPAEVLEFGGANWHDWCGELEDVHKTMLEMRSWLRLILSSTIGSSPNFRTGAMKITIRGPERSTCNVHGPLEITWISAGQRTFFTQSSNVKKCANKTSSRGRGCMRAA